MLLALLTDIDDYKSTFYEPWAEYIELISAPPATIGALRTRALAPWGRTPSTLFEFLFNRLIRQKRLT